MKKLLPITLALAFAGCGQNFSSGTRAGVVTKLSEKGLLWKSLEGDLVMALPPESGISIPEHFRFSVDPDDIVTVDKLQAALKSGRRVNLVYRQWFAKPLSIDTDYVITDVR